VNGAQLIDTERRRQLFVEGYDARHDHDHDGGELSKAAAIYALDASDNIMASQCGLKLHVEKSPPTTWPWEPEWWKPTPEDLVKQLVKAGALIAAEIDRELARRDGQ